MILRFFRRTDDRETIQRLYGAIVAQSRDPVFYTSYEVSDTIEGRFEMIILHAFLLFHRLKEEGDERRQLGQRVFDAFCIDMDANLREMGVGDLSVPKKMKRVAEAFYGRVGSYDAALSVLDDSELTEAVLRNVYGSNPGRAVEAQALATHIRSAVSALKAVPFEAFARGEFPLPPAKDSTFEESVAQ